MKTIFLALLLAMAGLELMAQMPPLPPGPGNQPTTGPGTVPRRPVRPLPSRLLPGGQPPAAPEEIIPKGMMDLQGVDVSQVLDIYAKLVNRTVLRSGLPDAKIVLKTQTDLTKTEAIEALQAVLAMNNISLINQGDKFVKAVQSDQAATAAAEIGNGDPASIPQLGSYVTHITQLKYVKPSIMVPLITPFAKLPNAVYAIDDNGILVIRDYAENVKRMLEMIARIDISVPAEYISEVIPIRYAKVEDIASALSALGGSGGGMVSIGGGTASAPISGMRGGSTGGAISGVGGGGIGGGSATPYGSQSGTSGNGFGGNSSFGGNRSTTQGATGPNGTPTGGSTFAQRLNNIVNRASGGGGGGQDQIQLFGQTKIIPDDSSSSLLIFATRQDMVMIKDIISKLDVPLAQVLVEAAIIDVSLNHAFNLSVSAAQNPKAFTGGSPTDPSSVSGAGGYNNGNQFLDFTQGALTNGTSFANSLGAGFSYFGNIGPYFDVAVSAAQSDSHATVIQRPRIQTSQAKPAQFFVGETVPYVTSTYNYGGVGGNSSSYSQLSVGVELDVTPFINPDGLVVMDINQEIDDLNGSTAIVGVGDVPNTTKRTLSSEIAVRDRDTVMMGGFIRSDKSNARSGVPFLQDVPLLGNLFTSRNDSKDRQELIVLMRPTVLKTPELAAENTIKEGQRLPGVSGAVNDDSEFERQLIQGERRKEQRELKTGQQGDGFYNMHMPVEATNTTPVIEEPAPNSPEPNVAPEKTLNQSTLQQAPAGGGTPNDASQNGGIQITPGQKAALDILRRNFEEGKISAQEYEDDRVRILSQTE